MTALSSGPFPAHNGTSSIGTYVGDIPAAYRQHTGYSGTGVFVVRVDPDSPGELAHVLPGDVLTAFGGTALTSPAQFGSVAAAAAPGTAVALAVERYGHPATLNVSPVDRETLFASPARCRASDADGLVSAAIEAGRRRDFEAEETSAERALDLYESCAAADGLRDDRTLLKSGDALLLQAAARVSRGERDAALPFAANAAAIYRFATRSADVSAAGRLVAQGKIDAIGRAFPAAAAADDDSIAAGLRTPGEWVTVVSSWSNPAGDTDTTLHVRVNLHPDYEAHFFATGFAISIDSRYIGMQTVYASDQPAAPSAGFSLHAKTDVDPQEDFRRLHRVDVSAGESANYVLTFVVPNDSEFSGAPATLRYEPR
jgi:hypothetical protein